MLARLEIPGAWMWSAWQSDRGMNFNSFLFERPGGCVAIDPLPLDAASVDAIAELGGVAKIVVTNPDHLRAAPALCERFGASIVDALGDGDEAFPGAYALNIRGGKTDEIVLHLPDARAAIVGDAILGAPAGALSFLPDAKLHDPRRLAFELRRVWALQLNTLLLGDGQPVFSGADRAIGDLLRRRLGAELYRINIDELTYRRGTEPASYAAADAEVGLLVGARKLGYRVAELAPGKAFCPLHWHVGAEEFFYVLSGTPSIRMADGTIECRAGDIIAFPVGERGTHQLRNDSKAPCLVMLVGMNETFETCFYPDSNKLGVYTPERDFMLRAAPMLDYFDGE